MSIEQFKQYLNMVSLLPYEREYVLRVIERFDEPTISQGITRDEFFKALDDMVKNPDDPIDAAEAERIKQKFA